MDASGTPNFLYMDIKPILICTWESSYWVYFFLTRTLVFSSKSEFVLYKLREMGMVANKDILLICKQFDSLGHTNDGKITLVDLMEGDSN